MANLRNQLYHNQAFFEFCLDHIGDEFYSTINQYVFCQMCFRECLEIDNLELLLFNMTRLQVKAQQIMDRFLASLTPADLERFS